MNNITHPTPEITYILAGEQNVEEPPTDVCEEVGDDHQGGAMVNSTFTGFPVDSTRRALNESNSNETQYVEPKSKDCMALTLRVC